MRMTVLAALVAASALLPGCANQKEPAEKAVAQIEASLTEVQADAERFAADELNGVREQVANLKTELSNQNYKAVVMQTPTVSSNIAALKDTVAKKKAEAEEMLAAAQQEWTELNASVPALVTQIQEKVDSFAKSRRVPKGLDKASFETAKQEFEALKTSWAEAGADFSSGMAADAVRRARAAKAKGEELLQKLGA
jgi:archaellum component FlaC